MTKVLTITEGLENLGALQTGGQGSVFKGRRLGEIFTAVKLLPVSLDEEARADAFASEAEKLRRLSEKPSYHVVKILGWGRTESGRTPFVEMEFVQGSDLPGLLQPPDLPVFLLKDVLQVAEQLSDALSHCHWAGIRHGDVRSSNVRMNMQTGHYTLVNFGLSLLTEQERRGYLLQSPDGDGLAPEQYEGTLTARSDVFGFGAVLVELLTGRRPCTRPVYLEDGESTAMPALPGEILPDLVDLRRQLLPGEWLPEVREEEMQVPGWLIETIHKCLERDPARRFADGRDLHQYVYRHCHQTTVPIRAAGKGLPAEVERKRLLQELKETEDLLQAEWQKDRQLQLDHVHLKEQWEKEKQQQLEKEKEALLQAEREKYRLEQEVRERELRLRAEEEKQRLLQTGLEIQRQLEAELQRQKQVQAELEREQQRQARLENDRRAEAEHERQRLVQAEWEKEVLRKEQQEKERQLKEEQEKEKQLRVQLEKEKLLQAELEKEVRLKSEQEQKIKWQAERDKERLRKENELLKQQLKQQPARTATTAAALPSSADPVEAQPEERLMRKVSAALLLVLLAVLVGYTFLSGGEKEAAPRAGDLAAKGVKKENNTASYLAKRADSIARDRRQEARPYGMATTEQDEPVLPVHDDPEAAAEAEEAVIEEETYIPFGTRFRVVANRAHFYSRPYETARRGDYLTRSGRAVVSALNDQNGFIYVAYTDYRGRTLRGWLRLADLRRERSP